MKTIKLEDIDIHEIGNSYQISGTIWSSATQSFITLFPNKSNDDVHFDDIALLPMTLEEWEKFLRQTDLLETEILQSGPTGIVKAIVRKSARSIDAFMQWAAFKRDNYTCQYCGRTGIPLTADHIDLWENGGATVLENVLSACKPCNKDRGRMEYDVWILSNIYKRKSANLPDELRKRNEDRVIDLPHLKGLRVQNVRSR